MKLRILLVGLMIALGSSAARATTYTALSSAEAAVAVEVALTVNGDTVQIPCSPSTSVWTLPLIVTKSITITGLGATPNSGTTTFGSGTNCLTIVAANPTGPIFDFTPTYSSSNNVTTLQNINIDPLTATTPLWSPVYFIGTATSSGFPEIRMDNVVLGNAVQWNETGNSSNSFWLVRLDDVIGVLDHNTLPNGNSDEFYSDNFSSYLGVGQYGDNSWAQPDSFGGPNNLFAENNLAYIGVTAFNECETSDSFEDIGGCRVVNRYNQVFSEGGFFLTGGHGLDTTGRPRSIRHSETYKNTITCNVAQSCNTAFTSYRGGTGLTWGNTATTSNGGAYNTIFGFAVYRTVYINSPFGACGDASSGPAAGPFDADDGITYYSGTTTSGSSGGTMNDTAQSWTANQFVPNGAPYSVFDVTQGFVAQIASNTSTSITIQTSTPEQPNSFQVGDSYQIRRSTVCMDQGGRGAGNYISGATPSGSPINQALDPVYEWDDTASNLNHGQVQLNNAGELIANRDWYTDNSNGSPTAQTSPSSPFNGTGSGGIGVGFGALANRPTTCTVAVGYFATDVGTQGTLYECLTPNTWTAAYTPYLYPHPLDTGGGNSQATVDPPATVNATVIN